MQHASVQCYLGCHVMRPGDDMVGASRVHNGRDQLFVEILPVVHPFPIINSETIDGALDWNIQHLQLLLKEGLLAPISLFHNPNLVWNALLICPRHPAAEPKHSLPMFMKVQRRDILKVC